MNIQEHDIVKLNDGSIGTIIHMYKNGAYEFEFPYSIKKLRIKTISYKDIKYTINNKE